MTQPTLDPQLLDRVRALPRDELRMLIAHAAGLLAHPDKDAAQEAVRVLGSIRHALRYGKMGV